MCNCRQKKGFALALSKAVLFERATGKEASIFAIGEVISFTDRDDIDKVEGICCYFTTNSEEHQIVKAKKTRAKKKRTRVVTKVDKNAVQEL